MRVLQHIKQLLRPSNQTFIAANALTGRFKNPVWVIGAGRSGNTWLCNLMCARQKYRFLFEPFHPAHNPEAGFLASHRYLRPGESDPKLEELANKIFTGKEYFPVSDPANKHKLFDGLLVKDISANLFSYALSQSRPEIDLILILRNPFAVALSRQNKPEWKWFNEPQQFLSQKNLARDFLDPYKELILNISESDDFILKQILIWAVIYHIPLRQFSDDQLQIVFYEDLLQHTDHQLKRLEKSLRSHSAVSNTPLLNDIKYQPSETTSLTRDDLRKKSPSDWQSHISKKQISGGAMILEKFGLDFLYDDLGNPAVSPSRVLTTMQKQG